MLGSGNWWGVRGFRSRGRRQFLADGLAALAQGELMLSNAIEACFISVDT